MKPYPKYKPSDIQWLGNIPEHWEVKKLKYVVDLINQKSDNIESTFNIALENIESGTGKIINVDADKEFEGELRPFQKNDVLFSKLRPYLCKVYLAEREGTCVGELLIFRPKTFILPNYLFYNVFSKEFINAVDGSTYGTKMPRASWEDFISHQLIPIPTLPEQTAIAQFLDQKTTQIDTLIAQKQRLISLLKEERMAFINEILSDESFPLKKLKYVTRGVQTGSTPPSDKTEYFNGNFDWFTPSDFKDDLILRNSKRKITDLAITHGLVKVYEPNSVLMIGIGATLGKIGLIEREASSNQQVNCITFTNEINPYFGAYFLNSISQDIVSMANAATLAILNQSQTKDIKIPCPPLETQQRIVESIETTTGKIDATLAKVVQEIELLKEYRVALISEVVTGKISVV